MCAITTSVFTENTEVFVWLEKKFKWLSTTKVFTVSTEVVLWLEKKFKKVTCQHAMNTVVKAATTALIL